MDGIIHSKLIYHGRVTLYKKVKGKKILLSTHNAGTLDLARFFAKTLTGSSVDTLQPKYIDLQKSDNESCLTELIPISDKKLTYEFSDYMQGYNWRVYFDTDVKKNKLKSSSPAISKAVLIASDGITGLAETNFNDASVIALIFESSENVVIEWQMELIYNPEGGKE